MAIVDSFNLKIDKKLNLFFGDNIVLGISKVGAVNMAIKTTNLLNQFNLKKIINIGVAGAIDTNINIGDIFLIDKIIDFATKKSYILSSKVDSIKTASITTLYTHTPKQIFKTPLVDMESSGFYQAAKKHNPIILKVASDYNDIKTLQNDYIYRLILDKIEVIQKIC